MSINNSLNESIVLTFFDLYTGLRIRKHLSFLFKSQNWTKYEIINYQNDLLKQLINHAYKNVPFYTELFDKIGLKPKDIRSVEDLELLPVLTKTTIRQNIQNGKLIAKNFKPSDLIPNSSSGSTGEPLQFYQCRASESMRKATAIRGWYWMGYRLGDKILRVSPIARKSRFKKIQDFFNRSYYLHTPILNDETFRRICHKLFQNKPKILRIYPDTLNYLTNYVEKNNINFTFIKAINTTGSILTTEVREKASRIFNCEIFDSFSCEGGAAVFESPDHKCYFSAEEYAITEVLGKNNESAAQGRLITTDLWNYATPFIRYDTQDIIELFDEIISTDIKLLPIKKIYGRDSDILVTSSGQLLIVNNFTGLFQFIEGLEQFQIHQEEYDLFKIYIKCDIKLKDNIDRKIREILSGLLPSDVKLNIVHVDKIEVEKSGKRRFLIRNKKIQLP